MSAKNALRRSIREQLYRLSSLEVAEKSARVRTAVKQMPEWKSARVICLYSALADEPEIGWLVPEGCKVCYPRVNGTELDLYFVEDPASMQRSKWNILEPAAEPAMAADHREIDIILLPGVAFSRDGGRLGRGAGYYDRLLGHKGWRAKKTGICFDCQLVSELPVESHDHPVDCIVTESGRFTAF